MFAQLLARLRASTASTPVRRQSARPLLEALEARLVLTDPTLLQPPGNPPGGPPGGPPPIGPGPGGGTFEWTGGGADSNFSTAANWSGNTVPGASDVAVFDGLAGASSNKPAIADGAFGGPLAGIQIDSTYTGNITVNTCLLANEISQTGSVITVSGTLSTQTYNLYGGTDNGTGLLQIEKITGNGSFNLAQGFVPTTINTATLTVDNNSTLSIGTAVTFGGSSVTLSGTSTWTAGNISLGAATDFANTGSFTVSCDQTINGAGGSALFDNLGSFVKNATNGITHVQVPFKHEGTGLEVKTGFLSFESSGGTFSAAAIVDSGATMVFTGPITATWISGASFGGNGALDIDNGADVVAAAGGAFDVSAVLYLTGATNPTLDGGGTVVSETNLIWQSGTIGPLDFTAEGEATLQTNGSKTMSTPFTNAAYMTFQDNGPLTISASFMNDNVFEIQNNTSINGEGTFSNEGLVTKTAGAAGGWNAISPAFLNSGTLDVNGFAIQFTTAFTQDVGTTDLRGGTIMMGGGVVFILDGGVLNGGGTIDGSLTANGGVVVAGSVQSDRALFVSVNYIQGTNATLQANAWGNNQFSGVYVGGMALLGGTLDLTVEAGYNPAAGDQSAVVTALDGVFGTFDQQPADWLTIYENNFVVLMH